MANPLKLHTFYAIADIAIIQNQGFIALMGIYCQNLTSNPLTGRVNPYSSMLFRTCGAIGVSQGGASINGKYQNDIFGGSTLYFGKRPRGDMSFERAIAILKNGPEIDSQYDEAYQKLYELLLPELVIQLGPQDNVEEALQNVWVSVYEEGLLDFSEESLQDLQAWLVQRVRTLLSYDFKKSKIEIPLDYTEVELKETPRGFNLFLVKALQKNFKSHGEFQISTKNWQRLEPALRDYQQEYPNSQAVQIWVLKNFTDKFPKEIADESYCSYRMLPVTYTAFTQWLFERLGADFIEGLRIPDTEATFVDMEKVLGFGDVKSSKEQVLEARKQNLENLGLIDISSRLLKVLLGYDVFILDSRAQNLQKLFDGDNWRKCPQLLVYSEKTLRERATFLDETYHNFSWRELPWLLEKPLNIASVSEKDFNKLEEIIGQFRKDNPYSQASQAWVLSRFTNQPVCKIAEMVGYSPKMLISALTFFDRYLLDNEWDHANVEPVSSVEGISNSAHYSRFLNNFGFVNRTNAEIMALREINLRQQNIYTAPSNIKIQLIQIDAAVINQRAQILDEAFEGRHWKTYPNLLLRSSQGLERTIFLLRKLQLAPTIGNLMTGYISLRTAIQELWPFACDGQACPIEKMPVSEDEWESMSKGPNGSDFLAQLPQFTQFISEHRQLLSMNHRQNWISGRPLANVKLDEKLDREERKRYLFELLHINPSLLGKISLETIQTTVREVWPHVSNGEKFPLEQVPDSPNSYQILAEEADFGQFTLYLGPLQELLSSNNKLFNKTHRQNWLAQQN